MVPPRRRSELTVYTVLVLLLGALIYLNIEVYYGVGGAKLVSTLGADAEWALAAAGVYLVIFELRKELPGPAAVSGAPRSLKAAVESGVREMAEPTARPVEVQVAVESLVHVGKIAAIVGPLAALGVAIATYLASQSAAIAILAGVVAVLVVLAGFLYFVREGLTDRLQRSIQEAGALNAAIAELKEKQGRIEQLVEEQKKEIQKLKDANAGFRAERDAAVAAKEAAARALKTTEQALAAEQVQAGQLTAALRAEQQSTARAPMMPELDASIQTMGFGILAPKNLVIRLTNVGAGNAVRISVSVARNPAGAAGRLAPTAFVQVLPPGQSQDVLVGNLRELAGTQSVRCRVEYESQFGPRPPVDLTWNLV